MGQVGRYFIRLLVLLTSFFISGESWQSTKKNVRGINTYFKDKEGQVQLVERWVHLQVWKV